MAEFYAVAQTKRKPASIQKETGRGSEAVRRCGEKRVLADFYANRRYEAGLYRDRWCKECAKEVLRKPAGVSSTSITTTVRQARHVDEARKKAIGELAQNSEFVSDADSERKEKVIDQRAGRSP